MVGMTAIIFAETGLFLGFFLPGDSLLMTAGLFAAKGDLNIFVLLFTLSIAAIVGDAVGFWVGKKAGALLYERKETFFFRRSHLLKAKAFYEKHGGKTIVLARFIPIVRTFAPTVAGAALMPYARFAVFNVAGGIAWISSMSLAGYALGSLIPDIDKHIHELIVLVVFLSVLPGIIAWIKEKRKPTVAEG